MLKENETSTKRNRRWLSKPYISNLNKSKLWN